MTPILYVILNGELKMSPGKAAAQAVHASMMLADNYANDFSRHYKRSVIVLEAENTHQMKNLHEYLVRAGLVSVYYFDEGVNEVGAYSLTAMAVQPINSDDKEKREMFSGLPLFGSKKKGFFK